LLSGVASFAKTGSFQPDPGAGAGTTFVHPMFGGAIFGFDIDQNGTEGVLSEAGGSVNAAVETFDQKTGKILKVVIKTQSADDFITMGVVGNSVGLVEREHVQGGIVAKRIFHTLNPLDSNRFTDLWTPPIGSQHIIMTGGVSRTQGAPDSAIFAFDNSDNFIPLVFESNIADNKFGPVVKIKDSLNFGTGTPPLAFDTKTHQAILGGGTGARARRPVIGVVDLTDGKFSEFTGLGLGFVNGIAVDSADGIFCTTTEGDANVEFYNLKSQTGFTVALPGSDTGADVEFDPIHKLFLIAQPESGTGSGSSIQVYDIKGTLVESINGFSFSNTFNVIPVHIALNPKLRSGFVDNDVNQNTPASIQSFTY
jgi:hypothetical protein